MTKSGDERRCEWCNRRLPTREGPGRPQRFCRQACRQASYVAGQRRAELGLSEAELIIARRSLDELRDRIYVLEAAIEDVDRDLDGEVSDQELREAIDWLLAAARPVVEDVSNLT